MHAPPPPPPPPSIAPPMRADSHEVPTGAAAVGMTPVQGRKTRCLQPFTLGSWLPTHPTEYKYKSISSISLLHTHKDRSEAKSHAY